MRPTLLAGLIGQAPLRAASMYNRMSNSTTTSVVGSTREHVTYKRHRIGSTDFRDLVILLDNYYFQAASIASAGTVTVLGVWIQQGTAGTRVQLTKGGSTTWSLSGATYDNILDPVPPSVFGLAKWSKGEVYIIQVQLSIPAGQAVALGEFSDAGYTEGRFYDPAVTTWDQNSGQTPTFTGTAPTTNFGCSPIVLGHPVGGDFKCWAGFGDSIFAQGSSTGYFTKTLIDNQVAGIQVGRSGGTWIPFYSDARGSHLAKYCTMAIEQCGTNPLTGQALGTSQTQAQSTWTAIRAAAAANPSRSITFKILRMPLLMKTGPSWGSLAAQTTITSGWGSGEIAEQFNDWLETQVGVAGAIDAFTRVDLGSTPIRGNTTKGDPDYYKWAPIANITIEGIHPYTGAMTPIQTPLWAAMQAA